jgi:hypothetical protein
VSDVDGVTGRVQAGAHRAGAVKSGTASIHDRQRLDNPLPILYRIDMAFHRRHITKAWLLGSWPNEHVLVEMFSAVLTK